MYKPTRYIPYIRDIRLYFQFKKKREKNNVTHVRVDTKHYELKRMAIDERT